MKKTTISILIPTLGRCTEVIETVKSLLNQTRTPDEIIVVDQNEPAISELDGYLKTVSIVKHIRNSQKGLCSNYNLALRSASSDVVLFVDDDIVADKNLVEYHIRHYENPLNSKIGGVAGRIIEMGQTPSNRSLTSRAGRYSRWTGAVHAGFDSLMAGESDFAQGCNMSLLRKPIVEMGGFDLGFSGNAYYFEPDACLRLKSLGYKIEFDPMAKLTHLQASNGGARIKDKSTHTFYFVRNGLRLYRRHSPRLGLPLYLLKLSGYVSAKALKNRDSEILTKGIKAIGEGLLQNMDFTTDLK